MLKLGNDIKQGSSNLVLEGSCPAEISSNLPKQTYLEDSSKTFISLTVIWAKQDIGPTRLRLDPLVIKELLKLVFEAVHIKQTVLERIFAVAGHVWLLVIINN